MYHRMLCRTDLMLQVPPKDDQPDKDAPGQEGKHFMVGQLNMHTTMILD